MHSQIRETKKQDRELKSKDRGKYKKRRQSVDNSICHQTYSYSTRASGKKSNDTARGCKIDVRLQKKQSLKSRLRRINRFLLHRDTKAYDTEQTPPHHTDKYPNKTMEEEPNQRSMRQQSSNVIQIEQMEKIDLGRTIVKAELATS